MRMKRRRASVNRHDHLKVGQGLSLNLGMSLREILRHRGLAWMRHWTAVHGARNGVPDGVVYGAQGVRELPDEQNDGLESLLSVHDEPCGEHDDERQHVPHVDGDQDDVVHCDKVSRHQWPPRQLLLQPQPPNGDH